MCDILSDHVYWNIIHTSLIKSKCTNCLDLEAYNALEREENNMGSRRRPKGRRKHRGSIKRPNFAPVVVILCLSVGCGYVTAKYIVDPVVNYVPQIIAEKDEEKTVKEDEKDTLIDDEVDVEETEKVSGYALQFGSYSDKASAETVMKSIDADSLQIIEQDNLYKIVGVIYKSKADAKAALENLPAGTKAFVTAIYQ